MRIKPFITGLLLLLVQQIAHATTLQASVSDNQVDLGDIFTLTVVIDTAGDQYNLDPTSLKQNFKVTHLTRKNRHRSLNGKRSQQIKWIFTLQAKRPGELTIPVLKVADLTTNEIKITVKPKQ